MTTVEQRLSNRVMGKRILFVEDNQDWRLLVGAALKDAGYDVLSVPGAAEALLQKNAPGFSLIVLDLDLGGENGLMLLQHLKRNHPEAPVVLFTCIEHDDQAIQQMLNQGADRYVRKGVTAELVSVVKALLEPAKRPPEPSSNRSDDLIL